MTRIAQAFSTVINTLSQAPAYIKPAVTTAVNALSHASTYAKPAALAATAFAARHVASVSLGATAVTLLAIGASRRGAQQRSVATASALTAAEQEPRDSMKEYLDSLEGFRLKLSANMPKEDAQVMYRIALAVAGQFESQKTDPTFSSLHETMKAIADLLKAQHTLRTTHSELTQEKTKEHNALKQQVFDAAVKSIDQTIAALEAKSVHEEVKTIFASRAAVLKSIKDGLKQDSLASLTDSLNISFKPYTQQDERALQYYGAIEKKALATFEQERAKLIATQFTFTKQAQLDANRADLAANGQSIQAKASELQQAIQTVRTWNSRALAPQAVKGKALHRTLLASGLLMGILAGVAAYAGPRVQLLRQFWWVR